MNSIKEMVIEYDGNNVPVVEGSEGNVIRAEGRAQPVHLNHKDHNRHVIETQYDEEEEDDKQSRKNRKPHQPRLRHERRLVKATLTDYYLYHIFDRRNSISTFLRSQRLFQKSKLIYSARFNEKCCHTYI